MKVDEDISLTGDRPLESDVEAFHEGETEESNIDRSLDNLFAVNPLFKIKRSASQGSGNSEMSTKEIPKAGSRRGTRSFSDLSTASNENDPLALRIQTARHEAGTMDQDLSALASTDSLVTRKTSVKRKSDSRDTVEPGPMRPRFELNSGRIDEETEEDLDESTDTYEFRRAFSGIAKPRTNSTPCKIRRTSELCRPATQLPSPIRKPPKIMKRRNTFSATESIDADTEARYRSDSDPQRRLAESPRLSRAAKTKANHANKELLSTVYGAWESSIEESTSGSIAEEIKKARQNTEQWTDDSDFFAWNEYTDGEKDERLFNSPEIFDKLRQHKFDKRTKEEFQKALKDLGQLLEEDFLSEARKDFDQKVAKQRTYIRTSYGRYSHLKSKKVENAEKLIMGEKEYLSVREYVESGSHKFIKNDYSEFVRELEKARKQRKKISAWFAAKEGSRLYHARDKYLSIICQLARKGLWKIDQALKGKMEEALADAKMNTETKRMELLAFQTKLKKLADVLTCELSLKELWLSNPTALYTVIPVPTSKELCTLLIDHILTEKYARRKIKIVGNARVLIAREAKKRGLVLAFRSISRREIRSFLGNKMQKKDGPQTPLTVIQIIHFLNKNPVNYINIILGKTEIGGFSNQILRMKKTDKNNQEKKKNNEEHIREQIKRGEIPEEKLPQGISNPQSYLCLDRGGNSKNIKDFKAELGKQIHRVQGNIKLQKVKMKPNMAIKNPSNKDVHELVQEINNRNKEVNEKAKPLIIVSCNPGKLEPNTVRDIQNAVPDANMILVNELRAEKSELEDEVTGPANFKVFYNDECPNGLIYSAIYISKDFLHLVKPLPNIGTATSIKLKLGENRSLNISNIYRNIDKPYEDDCFYKTNYNADCMLFSKWVDQCVELTKKDNAASILAGDWNCDTSHPRPQDNVRMFNTFFRGNCQDSAIDYFYINDARGVKVKALNFHREPLLFDGHTGHKITVNIRGLNKQYELKIRSKYDEEGIRRSSIKEAEKLRKKNIKSPEEYIKKAFETASKIIEENHTREASIGFKSSAFNKKQPIDTQKYYEAINFANKYLYDEGSPGKNFDEQEKKILRSFIRSISIMIKKLQRRDNEKDTVRLTEQCQNPLSAAWKITGELLTEPPVRELEENVEELMDEVVKMQKATTLSSENYTKHSFFPKVDIKIDKFKATVHPKKDGDPAILSEYRQLKDFTRGSTGISKKILDMFHISTFFDLIAKPILLAVRNGIYSDAWKTNRTVILPKRGKGIRPISISECYAKILEKILIKQITDFVEFNGLLPSAQNGFRSNLSTGTSLAAVNLFTCEALDKDEVVAIICIDMKNAFGTPSHDNLIKCFGNLFSGTALKVISESLERWAIVGKDGLFSRKEKMERYGVPQGSVVSPTLFCLFISELVNVIGKNDENLQINIFADDTIISCKGKSFEEMKEKAEATLDTVNTKLIDLGLQLVPAKTGIMIFDKNNVESNKKIRVLDTEITESQSLKYLGSTIGKIKGIIDFEINNELKINKMKVMVNRIKSIKNYIGPKAANEIHRAFSIGVLNHNFDILPKWKAKTHTKGQKLYMNALRESTPQSWYCKKEKKFEEIKRRERIRNLTKVGHPTFFESQIKLYHGQIYKALRFYKCEELAKELRSCLYMFSVDTGEKIGPIPDIFEEDRTKDEFNYFMKNFGIKRQNIITKETCVFHELIKTLIKLGSIELKIVINKGVGKIKKEICWPYNLHKDFNNLPRELRNAVINPKNKSIMKNFFIGRHKHPENKFECPECIEKDNFVVPQWVEEPSIHEHYNSIEIELIQELKKEASDNKEEARFESICEALDDIERCRPEIRISALSYEWLKRGSKKWSLKRCLAEIQKLYSDLLQKTRPRKEDMLQIIDASFKDVAHLVEQVKEDNVCFVGKDLVQVSSNIERYVVQLKNCLNENNITMYERIDAKILVEVRICSEYRTVIEENIAPYYISCAMLVDIDYAKHSLINPTDFVVRNDNVRLLVGHTEEVRRSVSEEYFEDLEGNPKAIFKDIVRLQHQGRAARIDEYFLPWQNTKNIRKRGGEDKNTGIARMCFNSVLSTQFIIDATKVIEKNQQMQLGMFGNVSKGFFDVCVKEEQSASITQTFVPVSFPFLENARKSSINNASCCTTVRKAAIALWECFYGNINDLSTKKLRRCKSIQCMGELNQERRWESHTVYATASVGCGFIFPVNTKDIDLLNNLIEDRVKELKNANGIPRPLTARKMIDQETQTKAADEQTLTPATKQRPINSGTTVGIDAIRRMVHEDSDHSELSSSTEREMLRQKFTPQNTSEKLSSPLEIQNNRGQRRRPSMAPKDVFIPKNLFEGN
ncbi:unnamed protein product [Oikopleura dioica]|uniref:Reverse transcriptase domain-containing protein n=1 Tax=Oikopleura dioica TaxID=34765 RepID=E4YC96_OIKDI|nr:unnamed protein product [Oikopleura dioica]